MLMKAAVNSFDNPGIHGLSGISIKPIDVYSKLVTEDMYGLVIDQTNLNALQVKISRRLRRESQLKSWKDKHTKK